jgi:hypothetical protein
MPMTRNYTFSVVAGKQATINLNLDSDIASNAKFTFWRTARKNTDYTQEAAVLLERNENKLSVTIPAIIANSSMLPANYQIKADRFIIYSGQITLDTTPENPMNAMIANAINTYMQQNPPVTNPAPTVKIGSVQLGNAGTTPKVTNSGTPQNLVLDFVIPAGQSGQKGESSNVPGPTGSAGRDSIVPGPKGDKGEQGEQGLSIVGPRGPKGDPGETIVGPQGPKGDSGNDSVVPGPPGPAGRDSTVPGPQGEKGDRGETGLPGRDSFVPGPQGEPGRDSVVPGPRGEKGEKGDTGPVSTVPGPKGDPGESIIGPTGPMGPPGATGPAGRDSIVPGPKGDKGDTGAASTIPGPKGEKGDQGILGPKGDTGIQGIQGLTGLQGVKGDTGSQGVKGDTGLTGLQGIQGPKGDQGIQGIQGVKGDIGPQGPAGVAGIVISSGSYTSPSLSLLSGTTQTITVPLVTPMPDIHYQVTANLIGSAQLLGSASIKGVTVKGIASVTCVVTLSGLSSLVGSTFTVECIAVKLT